MRVIGVASLLFAASVGCGDAAHESASDTPATATTGTTGPPEDIFEEWVGHLSISENGVTYLKPCDSSERVVVGLPDYPACTGAPLWLRIRGVAHGATIDSAEILAGPCLVGGCADDPTPQRCDTLAALCLAYTPPCDLRAQDCPAGQKCGPIDGDLEHADCSPLAVDAGAPGQPCSHRPVDTCDLTAFCYGTGGDAGVCVPRCRDASPACDDPDRTCIDDEFFGPPGCLTFCGRDDDCPANERCLPHDQDHGYCVPRAG